MRILVLFLFVSTFVSCTLTEVTQDEYDNSLIGVVFNNYIISTYKENKESYFYLLYADSAALAANIPFDSCTYHDRSFSVSSDKLQKGVWIRAKQFSSDLRKVYETNALFYKPVINKDTKSVTLGNNEVLTVEQRSPKCLIYSIEVYYPYTIEYSSYSDADLITGRSFDLYLMLDNKLLTNKNDHIDELSPYFNFKTPFEVDFQGGNSLYFYDNNFGTVPDSLVDKVKLNFSITDFFTFSNDKTVSCRYPLSFSFDYSTIQFVVTCKLY